MNSYNKRTKKSLAFILLTAMMMFIMPAITGAAPSISTTSPPTATNLNFIAAGTNTWVVAQGTDPDASIGQFTITFDADIQKSTASDVKVRAYGGVDGTTLLTLINESNIQGILFSFGDGTDANVLTKNVNSTYAQAIATVNANVDESETVTKVEFDIYDEGSTTDPLTISLILIQPGTVVYGDVNGDAKIDITDVVAMLNQIVNPTFTSDQLIAADVSDDNVVNIIDVVWVLNYIVNPTGTVFPVKQ